MLKSTTDSIFDVDLGGKTDLGGGEREGSSFSLLIGFVAGPECISQIAVIVMSEKRTIRHPKSWRRSLPDCCR